MRNIISGIIAYLTLAYTVATWSNPQELILVPFNQQHEREIARIYKENFDRSFSEITDCKHRIATCLAHDKVIGFIGYNDYQLKNNTLTRYIFTFAIDKPYQRKGHAHSHQGGYGTTCMQRFEDQARQTKITMLKLLPIDDGAAHFFKVMLGFQSLPQSPAILVKYLEPLRENKASCWAPLYKAMRRIKDYYSSNSQE